MNAINDARTRYSHGELWWYLPLVSALETVLPGLALVWSDNSIRTLLPLLPGGGPELLSDLDTLAALRDGPPPAWEYITGLARRIARRPAQGIAKTAVVQLYEAFACRWYETAQRYHMAVGAPVTTMLEALPPPADGFALVSDAYVRLVTTYGVQAAISVPGVMRARELTT